MSFELLTSDFYGFEDALTDRERRGRAWGASTTVIDGSLSLSSASPPGPVPHLRREEDTRRRSEEEDEGGSAPSSPGGRRGGGRRRLYGPASAAGDDDGIAAWCIVDG